MKNIYVLSLGIFLTLTTLAQTDLITSNSDFYNGSSSNWSKSGNVNFVSTQFNKCNSCPGYVALGVDNSGYPMDHAYGTLERTIAIPNNVKTNSTATLYFYMYVTTAETDNTTAYDVLDLQLKNSSSQGYTISTKWSNKNLATGYSKFSVTFNNIHTYAGQNMTLKWIEDSDGAKPSTFRIDDVSFMVETQSCTPVSISSEPQDKNVTSGNSVTFDISVTGTPPFSYFWYKNGTQVSTTSNSSSSSNSYTTPSLNSSDDGQYWYCLVTNCTNTYQDESRKAYVSVTTAQQYGSLNVTLTPQGALNNGAQWRVDGGNWNNSGITQSSLSVGSHSLEFKSSTGYNTPSTKNVNITANNTTYESGNYSSNPDPTISADISVLDFMSTCVSLTKYFTITNTGNADLIVQPISNVHANYSTDLNSVATIPPSGTKQIYVNFSPNGVSGTYNWVLKISSNATNQPQLNVAVNGSCNGSSTGVQFGFDNDGVYHMFWPFYNSANTGDDGVLNPFTTWDGQKLGVVRTDNWHYSTHDKHLGADKYAQDWNYPGGDCEKHFYSPMEGTIVHINKGCGDYCDPTNPDCGGGYGNNVMIRSANDPNVLFLVAHMRHISNGLVKKQSIKTGGYIGDCGMTGSGTGSHFHCTINKNISDYDMNQFLNYGTWPLQGKYAGEFLFDATEGGGGVSINNLIDDKSFVLYPNPSNGTINVELSRNHISSMSDMKIRVLDITGKEIRNEILVKYVEGSNTFQVSLICSSGIYYIYLEDSSGNKLGPKKFVVVN